MASPASPALAAAPAAPTTLLGLPSEVLGQRIVAHDDLDAASRLALFRTSHALARMVLLHAPGSKRLTVDGSKGWSAALLHVLGTRWQPLPLADLELKVTESSLPPPPPAVISQHVWRLRLHQCTFTAQGMAAWRLHDTALWPHLEHLTVIDCPYEAPASAATPQLQPIPRLCSFTWCDSDVPRGGDHIDTLGHVAANAIHARLELPAASCVKVLQHLQRLTHCHLQCVGDDQEVQALLQHPTLEHVTVGYWPYDFELQPCKQPCRWRTLRVLGPTHVKLLGALPLASLERLTIGGVLSAYSEHAVEQIAAGVTLLQQLHSGGRLVLLPWPDNNSLLAQQWQLPRGTGLFSLWSDEPSNVMALLRLVLEADQGINTLELDASILTSTWLREEVAPLLQHSGRIHTLCLRVGAGDEDWWGSLMGALPPCIKNAHVDVKGSAVQRLKALVSVGRVSLTRSLKLTLLHDGEISPLLEAELLQLAAGGAASGGGAAGMPLLSLEVVRTSTQF